jgi:FkbM family methyltransferase
MTLHDRDFAALARLLQGPRPVVIDIGAHFGHSIESIKAIFPGAVIHAFEPNPACHEALEALRTRCPDSVFVYRYGLGAIVETKPLYVPRAAVAMLSEEDSRRDDVDRSWVADELRSPRSSDPHVMEVELRVGDELAISPDLVRIDVEGAEFEVLTGLIETLQRSRPVLLIENSRLEIVTPFLLELDYVPFCWHDETARLAPYDGRAVNVFYLPHSRIPETEGPGMEALPGGMDRLSRLWQLRG